MSRRPGLTMTEVLIAIFVVAIGLAGVMSMVPFGAKQMSDALVADRATSHALTIDGLVRMYWRDRLADGTMGSEPFWTALETPPAPGFSSPTDDEPSYPVCLDPMGVLGRDSSNNAQKFVGDEGKTFVTRRNMALCSTSQLALRMWSQADGFTWDDEMDGAIPKVGTNMRELRYNALAVIQRRQNRNKSQATLKIVVFSNRRHLFYPLGSETVHQTPALVPGSTQIQLPTSVEVKKGTWVMDATVVPNSTIRHANFYRVVSAVENTPGTYDIELHTPIRRTDGKIESIMDATGVATIVVMPGVASVFEREPLTSITN